MTLPENKRPGRTGAIFSNHLLILILAISTNRDEEQLYSTDVVIIGAGAAGMMCAIEAGKRGRAVTLIDHAKKPGEKIRISGGGRCNFTNLNCSASNFISANPHFCKSALSQYSSNDFISLVDRHNIAWHEKTQGQLFCDNRSSDIIQMLIDEMNAVGIIQQMDTGIDCIHHAGSVFNVKTLSGCVSSKSLVIATGGKSIPKLGATGFGYQIARQFGVNVLPTRPGLVPFTFDPERKITFRPLAGISFECGVKVKQAEFNQAALFTHRGLSGPAMLQISSYWQEGQDLEICFSDYRKLQPIKAAKTNSGSKEIHTWLSGIFPLILSKLICREANVTGRIGDMSNGDIERLESVMVCWKIKPAGTEGYRTAEVTRGGVDTAQLNSRTMEVKDVPGLFFIGEVVDVTGWLGGYNFQWAWSSGWVAGQVS